MVLKNLGMPGGGAADAHKENVQMRWNDHNDLCVIRDVTTVFICIYKLGNVPDKQM